ncbi:MAG: hypothetical protein EPN45_16325 [Rhizobiaceae bacterium]|nr:MAG: hypothetical protein EPN45_16325 [Rhizobiaceae bacterium]
MDDATAIITASYEPDFERCKLLCETIDRFVTGFSRHYILVEHRDVPLFRQLEGPRRVVVDEHDLLPGWLRPFPDPVSLFKRRIWLSVRTQPLRGWHVQQLRRMAIAFHIPEKTLAYCDSDVVFLKDFDCALFRRNERLRLFRRDDALAQPTEYNHRLWSRNAALAFGLPVEPPSLHDYITTLIAWDAVAARDMCALIEHKHERHWIEVIASTRQFSECMFYGRYIDDVLSGAGHFHDRTELCRVYWFGPAPSDALFQGFVAEMESEQVAIGMQSFIGTDVARIRKLIAA